MTYIITELNDFLYLALQTVGSSLKNQRKGGAYEQQGCKKFIYFRSLFFFGSFRLTFDTMKQIEVGDRRSREKWSWQTGLAKV